MPDVHVHAGRFDLVVTLAMHDTRDVVQEGGRSSGWSGAKPESNTERGSAARRKARSSSRIVSRWPGGGGGQPGAGHRWGKNVARMPACLPS